MDASTLSLAPMMDYTDRHFRTLVRLISNRTLSYTEMVAANAVVHERKDAMQAYREMNPLATQEEARMRYKDDYLRRFLGQARGEGPYTVLQLGGSDPQQLFEATQTVMDLTERGHCDYTAINLNCGCPSPKVAGKGCFGAALMDEPKLVADICKAIHDGCDGRLPVTVKCRIGTDTNQRFHKLTYAHQQEDNEEEYSRLCRFIDKVASTGVVTDFSVHARIAVLQKSFSPADNRKIPPLKYETVYRLVNDFPELTFSLNGGIDSITQVQEQLEACPGLKGVMVGRAWAADPWSFAMVDSLLYGEEPSTKNRLQILQEFGKHADHEESVGDPVRIRRFIVKAISPLFTGEPNAKKYRIALDEIGGRPKRLMLQGKSLASEPPLSELILGAAFETLSEETLLRSPQESFERMFALEERVDGHGGRSASVSEWQTERKQQEAQG